MMCGMLTTAFSSLALTSHPPAYHHGKCPQWPHLVHGTPKSVGLLAKPLQLAVANITAYTNAANYSDYSYDEIHPIEPGSANIIGHCSTIVSERTDGLVILNQVHQMSIVFLYLKSANA